MSFDQRIRRFNHRRIDYLRALKLRLAVRLFAPMAKSAPETAKKILVLRMDDKVGDSITATGFLRELKLGHPNCQLIVVAGNTNADLYRNLAFVDEVQVAKKGIVSTVLLYLKLRAEYLFIINTSHILNPRVIFLCSLLPAFKKVGFANGSVKVFTHTVKIDFQRDHVTERYKKALEIVGVKSAQLDYQIKLSDEALALAAEKIGEVRKSAAQVILLNSFAGGRLRNFSRETTEKLVAKLLEVPDRVVISAANKGDHDVLNRWIAKDHARWLHFSELYSLDHNLALASLCDVIVTPDTAWVHMASALKKKLVAVYREDDGGSEKNSAIWAPYKTYTRIIFAPPNADGLYDINTVDAEKVAAKVDELLSLPRRY